jgi:hypothetical protein
MSLPADRTAAAAADAAVAVLPAPSDKLLLLLLLLSLSLSLPPAASLDSVPARPLSGIKLLEVPPELTAAAAAAAAGQVAMACPKRGEGPDLSFTCVQRQVVVSLLLLLLLLLLPANEPRSTHRSSSGPLSLSPPNITTWEPSCRTAHHIKSQQ